MSATRRKTPATTVVIPGDLRELLRDAAHARTKLGNDNASVSGIIVELIESAKVQLQSQIDEVSNMTRQTREIG